MSTMTHERRQSMAGDSHLTVRTFHVRTWEVRIHLFQTDGETRAQAVLSGDDRDEVITVGLVRGFPDESQTLAAMDDLAVSRALHALADALVTSAGDRLRAPGTDSPGIIRLLPD